MGGIKVRENYHRNLFGAKSDPVFIRLGSDDDFLSTDVRQMLDGFFSNL